MRTRKEYIRKNLIVNIVKYIVNMIMQFIIQTVLIYSMGAEYLGLNGLFTNIFAFLNLAELGIGSAIVYNMYKPIADGDIEKIKALQNLYKKFYLYIFIIIFIIGGVLTPFINIFINDANIVNINIYLLYVMYLVNTLIGYLSAHKKSLLFAYQRSDIENTIKTICMLGMYILQIIILILFKNYYLFFGINICATIIEGVLTIIIANKNFPNINGKSNVKLDKETKKNISKNILALSMHKIGGAVVNSTDNILISSLVGVITLGAYSNYLLIIMAITSIFAIFTNALQGSVGNLIASTNTDIVYKKYKMVNLLYSYLSAFATICFLVLIQPFIKIWTGGGNFLLNNTTVVLITISMYLSKMRSCTLMFRDTTGLFWKDRWKPIAEALVNLIASILLGYFIGLNGIIIGTIISTLVAPMWVEPYVLYKHYFKRSVWDYFKRYILDVIIMIVCAVICYFVCSLIPDGNIWLLIAKFATCIVLSNLLLIGIYCRTKEFKELWSMGKEMFRKFFNRKKVEQSKNI